MVQKETLLFTLEEKRDAEDGLTNPQMCIEWVMAADLEPGTDISKIDA